MSLDPQRYDPFDESETPAPVDRLSFIRPGQRRLDEGHSRVVKILRGALPAGALLVLLALIVWPMIAADKFSAALMKNIPDLVIKNLHFTGLDTKNEPYSMTALKATRPGGLHNIYDLEKPQAEITLTNGTWVEGQARYGRYSPDTHRLWLGGDVQLFQDKGTQFTTDEAQVDLNDNNAWGSSPVLIQGNFGQIRGQGFRLLDSGKVMVVTGPAHASLDLQHNSASDKPSAAAK